MLRLWKNIIFHTINYNPKNIIIDVANVSNIIKEQRYCNILNTNFPYKLIIEYEKDINECIITKTITKTYINEKDIDNEIQEIIMKQKKLEKYQNKYM